jgi:L-amino acid N-acyltransferase YncA
MRMQIREATADDWQAVWPFFHEIVAAGETYPYRLDLGYDEGRAMWLQRAPGRTVVAVDEESGEVLGTAKMNPNRDGNGDHVASASYMVAPAHGGRGVGRALCRHSLDWALAEGYRGMQFNSVVATNTHAVALYESLGFDIIGTVPEAFRHPKHGYVGIHVMYRPL